MIENRIKNFKETCKAYYQKTEFTWDLELVIDSNPPITRLVSPSHDIIHEFNDDDK